MKNGLTGDRLVQKDTLFKNETAIKRGVLISTVNFEVQTRDKAVSSQVIGLNKASLA